MLQVNGGLQLVMAPPALHVLIEVYKNNLLLAQYEMIERMAARISELEALERFPLILDRIRRN